jgi:hypothetical protein
LALIPQFHSKYNKKLLIAFILIFLISFLLKLTIHTIENYDYQVDLDKNAILKMQIDKLTEENQKLQGATNDAFLKNLKDNKFLKI